ncbi:LIC12162 family transferase [Maridesulfovibrio sp.]|uniref:LIC12162 family transferase n=1 Tax=Maridesulfovibrio sp. TaxID=2795000 RepID=UPI0029C9FF63|nr:LIC12162 family protein [Maridesulfovibrio sp.]
MKFKNVNIRATEDSLFWGEEYQKNLYLWQSVRYHGESCQFKEGTSRYSVVPDMYDSEESLDNVYDFAKKNFYRYLPHVAGALNSIHNTDLPVEFWRTALGIWLYRHICLVYDKYSNLQQVDIDSTSIKLLSESSYHVPRDHYDYTFSFANSHGVNQLVSQYYKIFAERTDFPEIDKEYDNKKDGCPRYPMASVLLDSKLDVPCTYMCESHPDQAQVGLCSVYYTKSVMEELFRKSKGKIYPFKIPILKFKEDRLNLEIRSLFKNIDLKDSPFDRYFIETLPFSFPKIFVEYFSDYRTVFTEHIKDSNLTHIVTEAWISFSPISLYCAIAKHEKKVGLVLNQHGIGMQFHKWFLLWQECEVADKYITHGWDYDVPNFVRGGVATRENKKYVFHKDKRDILHVGTTRFRYLLQIGYGTPATGGRFFNYLNHTKELVAGLSDAYKDNYLLRPRREKGFWDTESYWEVEKKGLRVDCDTPLSELIQQSRIVVIDHITTTFIELLICNVPFILVHYEDWDVIADEYKNSFEELIACGLVQRTPESAITFIKKIYDNVEEWWKSHAVQKAVTAFTEKFIGPSSRTTDFLLSLLKKAGSVDMDKFICDEYGVHIPPGHLNSFSYSDGKKHEQDVINRLEKCSDRSIFSKELKAEIHDWVSEYHFSRERHNLLRHVKINSGMNVLELGCGCGSITRQLGESGANVDAVEGSHTRARAAALRCADLENVKIYCSNFQDVVFERKYDLVTLIGVLEYSPQFFESENPIQECLQLAANALSKDGVLIVAIENQLGLKYFAGMREDHEGIPYFGIENRYNSDTSITYGRRELEQKIHESGLKDIVFHYPYPDYKIPRSVFTEAAFKSSIFDPSEIIRQTESRDYAGPPVANFDERLAVATLNKNGLLPDMANSFLVFASRSSDSIEKLFREEALGWYYTVDRELAYNTKNVFFQHDDSVFVQKKHIVGRDIATPNGGVLKQLLRTEKYIPGTNLEAEYQKCILLGNMEELFQLFVLQIEFMLSNAIAQVSSKNIIESTIKADYFDCVPSNIIIKDGKFDYIDREWNLRVPASFGFLLIRTIDALRELDKKNEFLRREYMLEVLQQLGIVLTDAMFVEYYDIIKQVDMQVYAKPLAGAVPVLASVPAANSRIEVQDRAEPAQKKDVEDRQLISDQDNTEVKPPEIPKARAIAFYLPQFHPIPENNIWWGEGFTEWTNTAKAKPLFEGHDQPHLPADLGFYDLRVPETRIAQAELASRYGIDAFCYWHYWFGNGKRLLERPFDEVVKSKQPDFPFCLGWANQTWSGIWHGAPERTLIEQTYPGVHDFRVHFEALLPAFDDPRYAKIDGRNIFLVYNAADLPDPKVFVMFWREMARAHGVPDFHFIEHGSRKWLDHGFDSCVANAPFINFPSPQADVRFLDKNITPTVRSYADFVQHMKTQELHPLEYPLAVPGWDNTPRSGGNGHALINSTPELFGELVKILLDKIGSRPESQRILFIKAWNEWAEGNYLEPDLKWGHGFLEALRGAMFT